MKNEYLDLLEFLPQIVYSQEGLKTVQPNLHSDNDYLYISYITSNNQNHSVTLPRFTSKDKETFEVLGLLQAEMGKTQNGNLSFANHEYKIINPVIRWFAKEFELDPFKWRWSIKLNIQEPENQDYKKEIEEKVINHWLKRTQIKSESAYPKRVTYIRNTPNLKLQFYDEGTLVLEYKKNLFSQMIKSLVKRITYEKIINEDVRFIRGFMKGIIAGEGTVEVEKQDKKYRVHISVSKEEEKEIYYQCLKKLGIGSIKYPGDKLIISKRENNVQLLKQRLMTLSPEKYAKFLHMVQQYPGIQEETGYFTGRRKPWNTLPDKINKQIIGLHKSGITRTRDIAEKLGISKIKVNRVLKENNLGKRLIKTSEEKREEIALFAKENPTLSLKQTAKNFNIHESVVRRACTKYRIKREKPKFKVPQEKIQKILDLYEQNPTIKYSEIMKEVGVSNSVIKNVRGKFGLMRLGYKHLIGCNNRNFKSLSKSI